MKKLLAAATRAGSPSASLYNADTYYRDSFRSGEILANLLFGPYHGNEATFLMDSIDCRRGTFTAWTCGPKDTWTYFRVDDIDLLMSFGSGISLETAKLIAAYKDSSCPLSPRRKEERTNRDDVLSAPHIYLDKTAGHYVRDMSKERSCHINLWLKGGEIERTKTWHTLR